MGKRHSENEIFEFITGDFQCAWDALAGNPGGPATNGGNFMFALLGAVLFEWACQLCKSDSRAQKDFAIELQKMNRKYFTQLVGKSGVSKNFPSIDGKPEYSLLGAIWDLIRNGQAHQYQDINVKLKGNGRWILMIRGVQHGVPLSEVAANRGLVHHLDYRVDSDGDVLLYIHPGVFFLDVRDAIMKAKLLHRGLKINDWTKGDGGRSGEYQYTGNQLVESLKNNSHVIVNGNIDDRPR